MTIKTFSVTVSAYLCRSYTIDATNSDAAVSCATKRLIDEIYDPEFEPDQHPMQIKHYVAENPFDELGLS